MLSNIQFYASTNRVGSGARPVSKSVYLYNSKREFITFPSISTLGFKQFMFTLHINQYPYIILKFTYTLHKKLVYLHQALTSLCLHCTLISISTSYTSFYMHYTKSSISTSGFNQFMFFSRLFPPSPSNSPFRNVNYNRFSLNSSIDYYSCQVIELPVPINSYLMAGQSLHKTKRKKNSLRKCCFWSSIFELFV